MRQIPAGNPELTFELELVCKGLNLNGEAVEVEPEQALEVVQLLGAEVPPRPGPQEADGAQGRVPAVRLHVAQPARALRVCPAVVGKRGGLEYVEGQRLLCGRTRGTRGLGCWGWGWGWWGEGWRPLHGWHALPYPSRSPGQPALPKTRRRERGGAREGVRSQPGTRRPGHLVGAQAPPAGPPRRSPCSPRPRGLPRTLPTPGACCMVEKKSLESQEQREQHCGAAGEGCLSRTRVALPSRPSRLHLTSPAARTGNPHPLPTSLSEKPSRLPTVGPRGSHFPSLSATLWLPDFSPRVPHPWAQPPSRDSRLQPVVPLENVDLSGPAETQATLGLSVPPPPPTPVERGHGR